MDISHNFPTMGLISAGEFRRISFQLEERRGEERKLD